MNQPHISMWTYLWDLVDDGIEEVLRHMKGDLGLSALSVATHYHSVEHLRPHTSGASIYRADSALYFQPEESRYQRTALRHRVASVAQAGNPLGRVADQADKLGLDLVSWTLCCHSSYLAQGYPSCAQRNTLGDRLAEYLCPANPDVREYLKAMAADLSHNYRLSLLELESCHYAPSRHFHRHDKIGLELGPVGKFLMALCFCEHCRTWAEKNNVDVHAAFIQAHQTLREGFDQGSLPQQPLSQFLESQPQLAAYVLARRGVVESLLEEIQAASAVPISPAQEGEPLSSALSLSACARITGSATILAYTSKAQEAKALINAAAQQAGGVSKLRVGLAAYPPVAPDMEALLSVVEAALEAGVRSFSFYNYGIMPRPCLEWVRRAVSVIRRG